MHTLTAGQPLYLNSGFTAFVALPCPARLAGSTLENVRKELKIPADVTISIDRDEQEAFERRRNEYRRRNARQYS